MVGDELFDGEPRMPNEDRGIYLCEVCEDVMTDNVVRGTESPTGLDMAICRPCLVVLRRGL